MTMIRPGSKLATGNDLIPQILKPVTNIINPPNPEKSATISGVSIGIIDCPIKSRIIWTINCGIAIVATERPSRVAKIPAVRISRNDLVNSIDMSPVIPSCIAPKMPVPEATKSTRIPTNLSRYSSCDNVLPLFCGAILSMIKRSFDAPRPMFLSIENISPIIAPKSN
ncbi:hypothetical protein SK88_01600 [Klebsiella oxytoca]|nr:hypothetical protein SK88_01600 [Klebsiella oxytoca]VEF70747.1 Uncharacterised protein [Klebsiella oxytoca]VGP13212.1 hypothetical protein SB00175_02596 [Klebsiella oxytoca]